MHTNLRTFQRLPLKFKDFSRLCEPCYWRADMPYKIKPNIYNNFTVTYLTTSHSCKARKNLKFQLVLWASSSHILLACGPLLLVLVNDFVRGWYAWTLAQCSPYQVVTGKISHLKQQYSYRLQLLKGLLKLNTVFLKNSHVVIWSNQGNEWICAKVLNYDVYTAFFYGPRILEWEQWRQSKIIGIQPFNYCCIEMTKADLHKIGLEMREWRFRELRS